VRVVLDTNVFISGVFFTGPPHKILRAWRNGTLRLCVSAEIVDEYVEVADRLASKFPPINPQPVLTLLSANAEIHDARPLAEPVSDDPDDDKFIACAVASGSRMIVSGDRHLLRVSGHAGVEVLRPRDFVEKHLGR